MRAFSPAVPPSNRSAVVVGGGTTPTLLTDLIAYYRFNGNGNDSSGNNRDLGINSGTLVPGALNGALSSGFAQTPDPLDLPLGKSLTISAWVNLGASIEDSLDAALIVLTTTTDPARKLIVKSRDETNVTVKLEYTDSTATLYENSGNYNLLISDNQWLHVVAVVSQTGGMSLYVDGTLLTTEIHPNEDFTVGTIGINTLPDAESKAGDIGIWSRALSQAEVTQLYNSGNGLDPTA